MTLLTKPVTRETSKVIGSKPVLITIAPAGAQDEALIGMRLKNERTQYVVALSDLYRIAALWYGQREAAAKKEARKNGIPWKRAKIQFKRQNTIQKYKTKKEEL